MVSVSRNETILAMCRIYSIQPDLPDILARPLETRVDDTGTGLGLVAGRSVTAEAEAVWGFTLVSIMIIADVVLALVL
jgi:hypothetical protein